MATDVGVAGPFAQMIIDAALKGPPFRREEALRRERWRATDLRLARKNRTLAAIASMATEAQLRVPPEGTETMVPGFDDAKTTEMRARLDDRLGLWAVTCLLFFVKLGPGPGAVPGPGLRHLDRLAMAVPESGAASSGLARSSPETPKLLATHGRRAVDDV